MCRPGYISVAASPFQNRWCRGEVGPGGEEGERKEFFLSSEVKEEGMVALKEMNGCQRILAESKMGQEWMEKEAVYSCSY